MFADPVVEPDSPNDTRLPSLMALRCFEAAARREHFRQAADELHLTPGAVSRAVRLLEDQLGLALFERRQRRVHLTDAGRQLAAAVSQGFGLIQQTLDALQRQARQPAPAVLSCEPTLLMRWLIPRWNDFCQAHPGPELHLLAGGGAFRFGAGIDLAIRRDDFPWPAGCHAHPLFHERIGPVCRPEQLTQWFVERDGQWQLRPQAPRLHTRTRPQAWPDWHARQPAAAAAGDGQTFEHFYFSLQAAVAGLGVAIGPWHLVRDDLASGLLVAPMGFVEDGSRYCLLTPTAIRTDSREQALLEWLRRLGAADDGGET